MGTHYPHRQPPSRYHSLTLPIVPGTSHWLSVLFLPTVRKAKENKNVISSIAL